MKKHTDERTQQAKFKATSTGFLILSWGLMVVLLYRFYFLEQNPEQLMDFFVIWLAGNAYVAFSSTLRGVQPFDARPHMNWIVSAVIAVTVTGVQVWQGALESLVGGAITFGVAFVASFALYWGLQLIYKMWERRNLG